MTEKMRLFWASIRPLVGQMVGAGLFALPFVFSQAGFGVGLTALAVSAIISIVTLLMFADLALALKGHHRFVGLIHELTGPVGGFFAAIGLFGSIYGSLVAYTLIGGSFAYAVFSPLLPLQLSVYRVIFFIVSTILIAGGSVAVRRFQKYIIGLYVFGICLLAIFAAPHIAFEHFIITTGYSWFLPFGVTLFSMTAFTAVPEMRDILGLRKILLPRAVIVGTILVAILYAFFAFVVVGVTGLSTTPETLHGLGSSLGIGIVILASAIGLCTVMTAFISQGIVLHNTLLFDFHLRYFTSIILSLGIPIIILALGVSNITRVIDLTGGLFVSLMGLCIVAAYERLRLSPQTTKHALYFPRWVSFLVASIFAANIVVAVL
jgi:amino acid permease